MAAIDRDNVNIIEPAIRNDFWEFLIARHPIEEEYARSTRNAYRWRPLQKLRLVIVQFVSHLLAGQNMIERRHVGTVWMTALRWLLQLPRIADQHHRLRGMRNRKHIGQRHLCSFVDKKHVNAFEGTRGHSMGGDRRLP
jgi:hypothetical protein